MDQDALKRAVAHAALDYVVPGEILGVGSGSTVRYFIDALAKLRTHIPAAVASSEDTRQRLEALGIRVLDLNGVSEIAVYIDGADEINPAMQMIKGGGGALTREKIVAAVSKKFVCIVDRSKYVEVLGRFPLPIEVIPMAQRYVACMIEKLGGRPRLREGFVTDNGNLILDVHGWSIEHPETLESSLNQIAGVVTNGLFAARSAEVCLLAGGEGVACLTRAGQEIT